MQWLVCLHPLVIPVYDSKMGKRVKWWLGWIPGLRIAITFLFRRILDIRLLYLISESCWFRRYQTFGPIPWEYDFEILAQISKLRGMRQYAWVFYSQNHPVCSAFYAGHFHIWNKGYSFDFTSAHAIWTHVITIPVTTSVSKDVEFSWYTWKVCRIMSTYSNAHAKVKNWIFDFQFPGNWFLKLYNLS